MTKRPEGHFQAAKGGQLEKMMEERMAARKKKKKTTRKIRQPGESLPKMIDSDRVLRALDGILTEKQFIKRYDDAAGPRGRAAAPLSAAQKSGIKSFMEGKVSREDAMAKAGIRTAGAFLNLMERYHEEA